MTGTHFVGIAMVLVLMSAVGIYSGKNVKTAADFAGGTRNAGAGMVAGAAIGSLVGGASTIGTAQLAFSYGFSAWWFTLGSGIGCILMGLFFAKPIYNSGITTVPQIFTDEYGEGVATLTALFSAVGNFISVIVQIMSGIALITAIVDISPVLAALILYLLTIFYVVFGGIWGAGLVGLVKTILLYAGVGLCGLLAIRMQGGLSTFSQALPATQYFNMFAQGFSIDLASCLSMVLGTLTTQAYIQAIVTAKNLKLCKRAIYTCAVLIPMIGIASIYIGMYMKLNYPDVNAAFALPQFVLMKTPPLLAGIILATLLVAIVGSGAGVSLAMSTMVTKNIYSVYIDKNAGDQKTLLISRLFIVVMLGVTVLLAILGVGDSILGMSYLSMGFRGAIAFIPMCTALFLPGRIKRGYVFASMLAAAFGVVAGKFLLPAHIDSQFLGVALSALIMGIGWLRRHQGASPMAQ